MQRKKKISVKYCLQLESSGLSVGHFGADITDGNFAQMQEQDTRKRYAERVWQRL